MRKIQHTASSWYAFGSWLLLTMAWAGTGCSAVDPQDNGGAGGFSAVQAENPWADGEDCRNWGCAENSATHSFIVAPSSSATACTDPLQCPSGFCVDGVCCDAACTGTCQACTAAKKGTGDDGVCGNVVLYGNPDNECTNAACDGTGQCKSYNGVTCSAGTGCLSGYCVDGYCCGNVCTGSCQACSIAKRGGGYNGQCGNIAAGTDPDDECTSADCNGSGACMGSSPMNQLNGTLCTTASQCASGNCVDGYCCGGACTGTCQACSIAKRGGGYNGQCGTIAAGTDPDNECAAECNGSGACTLPMNQLNGKPCTLASQCASGYCVDGVCCGAACTETCRACTVAKKGSGSDGQCGTIAAGTDPDNECANGECNGSAACTTAAGTISNGSACTTAASCLSGFCVDGVCCDNACTGACEACTATKKSSGVNGVCGFIAANTNPDGECAAGKCNGSGACFYYNGVACTATSQCMSGNCVDGYCCNGACTETCRACSAAKKGSGFDGTCGNIAASTDPDNECGGDCNGAGVCLLGTNGVSCTAGAQCGSGSCVDGVCCDNACSGACRACAAVKKGSGADGVCGDIAIGTDPDSECGAECNGSGACAGQCSTISFAPPADYAVSTGTRDFTLADLNGDGATDLATIDTGNNTIAVILNNGDGTFGAKANYAISATPRAMTAADFNGDGHIDLAIVNGTNEMDILFNNGNGTFAPRVGHNVGNTYQNVLAAGDLNGDGYPDLIYGGNGSTVDVAFNNGDGTFSFSAFYSAFGAPVTPYVVAIAVGDFNGDGSNDFAVACHNVHVFPTITTFSSLAVFINDGQGAFPSETFYNTGTWSGGAGSATVIASHLNGDTLPDIVVTQATAIVLLNDGTGAFPTQSNYGSGNHRLVMADVNGDGGLDLVQMSTNALRIYPNTGDGTFGPLISYNTGTTGLLSAADLNGDSKVDIVVQNDTTSSVFLNNCQP